MSPRSLCLSRALELALALALFLVAPPAMAVKECPGCGKTFDNGVNFCPFDGKTLVAAEKTEQGKVEISLNPPDATLTMDGLPRGSGPKQEFELAPGEHSLEAAAPGFSTFHLTFSLSPQQDQKLTVDLTRLPADGPGESDRLPGPDNTGTSNRDSLLAARLDAAMVEVKPGFFVLGSDRGNYDERPVRKIKTPGFWIDKYEVTCAQYLRFLESVKKMGHVWCHPNEQPNKDHTPFHTYSWALRFSWLGGSPPAKMSDYPVVLVDWFDAYAFAKWAGKRLPTEDEWEIAAGGGRGMEYPWGNAFSAEACNVGDYPIRIGSFPGGASPWGGLDMAGNIAEWTVTMYEPDARDGKPFDGRHGQPIIRGGSWDDESRGCRVSARDVHRSAFYRSTTVGFRCVSDVPPEGLKLSPEVLKQIPSEAVTASSPALVEPK